MTRDERIASKRRIFDAAVALFARKGYAAVGVREIAREARVNISMINYYYGGKVGLLKSIIDECYDKYLDTIKVSGDADTPLEEHVRNLVSGVVAFFRGNTELALVAFGAMPVDIPEIIDLKVKWVLGFADGLKTLHGKLGIDGTDAAYEAVVRRALPAMMLMHFQGMYAWQFILREPEKHPVSSEYMRKISLPELDDAFFEHFSDVLSDLFLYGVTGIIDKGSRNGPRTRRSTNE
jgi:AcrR family transcriptional regulator